MLKNKEIEKLVGELSAQNNMSYMANLKATNKNILSIIDILKNSNCNSENYNLALSLFDQYINNTTILIDILEH